ncbi:hypothetical protein NUW54_g804 [Trametes sanguinea]|uniref:Uncharacterized protein n=1 Tax=Trametes sanguinea TaxID=158606 RepID=A0ACC1QBZ7_9APHY|nr:hypothetical protein NUW54_g804 [Trametes sanguinea]
MDAGWVRKKPRREEIGGGSRSSPCRPTCSSFPTATTSLSFSSPRALLGVEIDERRVLVTRERDERRDLAVVEQEEADRAREVPTHVFVWEVDARLLRVFEQALEERGERLLPAVERVLLLRREPEPVVLHVVELLQVCARAEVEEGCLARR